MVSDLRLQRLKKKQQLLLQRRQKQEQEYRAMLKSTSLEAKSLDKQIEDEQYAVTIKLLRQTGFPVDNIAILVGMAIKATEVLNSTTEDKSELINMYISRYNDFMQKLASQKKAEPGPLPADEEYSGTPPSETAEGMG